jgi:hypothetical protein
MAPGCVGGRLRSVLMVILQVDKAGAASKLFNLIILKCVKYNLTVKKDQEEYLFVFSA